MNKYTVFLAQTATGFSAHVPDLPGCIAAAPRSTVCDEFASIQHPAPSSAPLTFFTPR
jgi:hypothetical protein